MSVPDHAFKFLMVGDSGVGKTSLLLRFTQDSKQNIDQLKSTVGVDLKVKQVSFGGKSIKLTIWDTAGQERFRTLTSAYYRGAHGIILVYDITSRESFDNLQEWLKEIDIYSTRDDAIKLLVANKIDMDQARSVTTREGRDFARQHSMLFMECSAKTEVGVQQAFHELLQKILDAPVPVEENNNTNDGRRNLGEYSDSPAAPETCQC